MAHRVQQPFVFLDRDGTINVDYEYVGRIEQWELLPGVSEAIKLLKHAGYGIAVVSNQSGIAKGKYCVADVELLHQFARQQLANLGASIDAIAYCPHSQDAGCDCRKPRPGLFGHVENQVTSEIDVGQSWMIGDKPSDVEFGKALGMRTILLRSKYWEPHRLQAGPDAILESLAEAAALIVGRAVWTKPCEIPGEIANNSAGAKG